MTRNQWRRHQRNNKATFEVVESSTNNKASAATISKVSKRPVKQIIFPALPPVVKNSPNTCKDSILQVDDEMVIDNFDFGSEVGFNIICNVVFVLPIEFDCVTEVTKTNNEYFVEEMENHKPVSYYIMNNDFVEEQQAMFERLDAGMMNHLKPMFIQYTVGYRRKYNVY